jgi:hypothetical protein
MHAGRAPGRKDEVKIVGVRRNLVVLALLSLGIILLYRTRALLTLAIAVVLGAPPSLFLPLAHSAWSLLGLLIPLLQAA